MRKIGIGILGITLLLLMGRELVNKNQISNDKYQANNKLQITKHPTPYNLQLTISQSLFIPYWSTNLSETDMKYDSYYYFGIAPTAVGEIENEVGLQNMPMIVESLKSKAKSQKKLVIRMLDNEINESILTSQRVQGTLADELLSILNKNSFSGIVLDIEVPFTLQATKKGQITNLVQQICTAMKANYKTCDMLIYGDFSYRNRPYDLKTLGKITDKILLMAYDFHKAGGEPGPNFDFDEKQKYGYDFKQMVADATALVPKEKIEVVFGMYGYDWTLNEQGTPLKSATALSVNNIRSKVLRSESLKVESNEAKEKNIKYIDEEGVSHIIWYEDEESTAIKTEYLYNQGIGKISYWAYGYF